MPIPFDLPHRSVQSGASAQAHQVPIVRTPVQSRSDDALSVPRQEQPPHTQGEALLDLANANAEAAPADAEAAPITRGLDRLPENFFLELEHLSARSLANLAGTSRRNRDELSPEVSARCARDIRAHMATRFQRAQSDAERILQEAPSVIHFERAAHNLLLLGRYDDVKRLARIHTVQFPTVEVGNSVLIRALLQSGEPREAIEVAGRVIALLRRQGALPSSQAVLTIRQQIAKAHLLLGEVELAQAAMPAPSPSDGADTCLVRAMIQHSLGHADEAEQQTKLAIERAGAFLQFQGSAIAETYAWRGDVANALRWMDRSGHAPMDRDFLCLAFSPFSAPIRRAEHWQGICEEAARLRQDAGSKLGDAWPVVDEFRPTNVRARRH